MAYGRSLSYRLGLEWLEPCDLVEDWGCGLGWARTLVEPERYRGVDGSPGHADVVADLCEYRSDVPGVFMRHVLEHNYRWPEILDNAVASFTRRMSIVLFTPTTAGSTHQIDFVPPGVPDLSFRLDDLLERIDAPCRVERIRSPQTAYGRETLIYAERPD